MSAHERVLMHWVKSAVKELNHHHLTIIVLCACNVEVTCLNISLLHLQKLKLILLDESQNAYNSVHQTI